MIENQKSAEVLSAGQAGSKGDDEWSWEDFLPCSSCEVRPDVIKLKDRIVYKCHCGVHKTGHHPKTGKHQLIKDWNNRWWNEW